MPPTPHTTLHTPTTPHRTPQPTPHPTPPPLLPSLQVLRLPSDMTQSDECYFEPLNERSEVLEEGDTDGGVLKLSTKMYTDMVRKQATQLRLQQAVQKTRDTEGGAETSDLKGMSLAQLEKMADSIRDIIRLFGDSRGTALIDEVLYATPPPNKEYDATGTHHTFSPFPLH